MLDIRRARIREREQSVASFIRWDQKHERFLVCVLNATPVVRHDYRIGVPRAGEYIEVLNTDSVDYGGSGVSTGARVAVETPHHGQPASMAITLPPLAVVWLALE